MSEYDNIYKMDDKDKVNKFVFKFNCINMKNSNLRYLRYKVVLVIWHNFTSELYLIPLVEP